jgi:ATP-dependent DNA helicase DinG
MPDFEPRAGQAEMAAAVARLFESGGVLLAEAGTGTGKTLAYLVPAILSRQRVLISTGTKNLQEQIYFKDIPALRAALNLPFTATYMKGRANYLCRHRLDQLDEGPALAPAARASSESSSRAARASESLQPRALGVGPRRQEKGGAPRALGDDVFLPIIREWSTRTETGDRAELEDLPEDLPFWNDVAATAETCLGTECPRYDDCFVTRLRQRAAASDVVIVNHHLLCADAAVRQNAFGEVIPACSNAILDEAHQLEDVATQYFGYSVSNYRCEELARDVERFVQTGGVAEDQQKRDIAKAIERLRDHAQPFFTDLANAHRSESRAREQRVRASSASLAAAMDAAADLTGALDILEASLALIGSVRLKPDTTDEKGARADRVRDDAKRPRPGSVRLPPSHKASADRRSLGGGGQADQEEDAPLEAATLARRAGEIRDELRLLLRAGDAEFVYFVEIRGRGVFLRAAPIDVSAIVRELLLDRMRTTVLTSATLTVDGTFEYVRQRLGIARAEEIRLPSEFDFAAQAILYLPPRMPDPRSPDFSMAAGRQVIEILKRTGGRAFVLFTSYATMHEVLAIAEMALNFPIFAQGTAPRSQLLEQFRDTPHSVLFATSSFWQGVDVVGEALSCVIIDKLPFASPADPITAARIDAVRERGGDPFGEYQVPLAIVTLQQGLGRLIRHRRDRGVLAVLDPRLRTKGYGRRFLTSLPPAPLVHDLEHVESFFR